MSGKSEPHGPLFFVHNAKKKDLKFAVSDNYAYICSRY